MNPNTKRAHFLRELELPDYNYEALSVLTVAVQLPNGAIEVITNTQQLRSKIEYYLNAYDEEFKSKSNPDVRIVGYMLV